MDYKKLLFLVISLDTMLQRSIGKPLNYLNNLLILETNEKKEKLLK